MYFQYSIFYIYIYVHKYKQNQSYVSRWNKNNCTTITDCRLRPPLGWLTGCEIIFVCVNLLLLLPPPPPLKPRVIKQTAAPPLHAKDSVAC